MLGTHQCVRISQYMLGTHVYVRGVWLRYDKLMCPYYLSCVIHMMCNSIKILVLNLIIPHLHDASFWDYLSEYFILFVKEFKWISDIWFSWLYMQLNPRLISGQKKRSCKFPCRSLILLIETEIENQITTMWSFFFFFNNKRILLILKLFQDPRPKIYNWQEINQRTLLCGLCNPSCVRRCMN